MREPRLTHLDRAYWPDKGYSKRDLVDYYRAVAPVLLPHIRNRPFTLKRHHTVRRGPFAWVKDAPPELPAGVKRCPQLPSRAAGHSCSTRSSTTCRRSFGWSSSVPSTSTSGRRAATARSGPITSSSTSTRSRPETSED